MAEGGTYAKQLFSAMIKDQTKDRRDWKIEFYLNKGNLIVR